jgi:hypothetical protein
VNPFSPRPTVGTRALLLDSQFVSDTYNMRRVLALPDKHPGPVLTTTASGEWSGLSYPSTARDPETGKFHLWYTVTNPDAGRRDREARAAGRLEDFLAAADGVNSATGIAYAQSEDGIHWQRPAVGTGPRKGTNVVYVGNKGVTAGCVMQGLFKNDPARKFTAYFTDWLRYGHGGHGYAHSPDGIHWTPDPANPFIFGESDSNNCIIKNPFGPGYLLYERPWESAAWGWVKGNHRKRIAGCWSPDGYNWSRPKTVLCPDELEDFDYYGISVFEHDGVLFGLLSDRHPKKETMDIHLIFSRDGANWEKLPTRQTLLPRGPDGSFDSGMVLPAYNPINVNGDLRLYYAGRPTLHDDNVSPSYRETCGIGLATFKKGRLIGRRADSDLGILLTHPFTIEADRLCIDVATAGNGWVEAELVEFDEKTPGGKQLPGFAREDFDKFTGDSTGHELSWRGKNVASLKGRLVRLRVGIRMGTIWSYHTGESA